MTASPIPSVNNRPSSSHAARHAPETQEIWGLSHIADQHLVSCECLLPAQQGEHSLSDIVLASVVEPLRDLGDDRQPDCCLSKGFGCQMQNGGILMNSMRKVARNESGITMMEMMIIVVIIGIMAAMAAPEMFAAIPRMEAKAEIRGVVSSLREARSLAVSRKEPFGVAFNQTENNYKLFADRDLPADHVLSGGDSVFTTSTLSGKVMVATSSFPNTTVVFQPDGSASSSGAVSLYAPSCGAAYTVDVLASTGRVKMVEGFGY
jgi:Tfp pilus assembly protein FimT